MSLIPVLPNTPGPSRPTTLEADTEAFLLALNPWGVAVNAMGAQLTSLANGTVLALQYGFSTTTTIADPTAGFLRLDNATQNLATNIVINVTDLTTVNLAAMIDTFDDSTSTIKAWVKVVKQSDPSKFVIWALNSMVVSGSYRQLGVTPLVSSGGATPFALNDALVVQVLRNGDKGDNGALGLGAASPGTGNVTLTNGSSALQRIFSGGFGAGATLPDATTMPTVGMPIFKFKNTGEYPMYVNDKAGTLRGWCYPTETTSVDLHDKSTAAGQWDVEDGHLLGIMAQYVNSALTLGTTAKVRAVTLDSDRVLVLFGDTTLEAFVYVRSTGVIGVAQQIATGLGSGTWAAVLAATDKVLVVYDIATPTTTSLAALTLSISSSTITVNAAVNTAALTAALSNFGTAIVAFNGAFGFGYTRGTAGATQGAVIGISVTGTVPAFGADATIGASNSNAIAPHLYVSGTTLIAMNADAVNFNARPYTIAGNTLTAGTAGTFAATGTGTNLFRTLALGARWVGIAQITGGAFTAGLVSLSGTTCTVTSVATGFTTGTSAIEMQPVASATKVVISCLNTTARFNVLTDTSGTISAGTALNITGSSAAPCFVTSSASAAKFIASDGFSYYVDCSGVSAVATQNRYLGSAAQLSTFTQSDAYMCQRNYSIVMAGSMGIALPTAGTQSALLGVTLSNHRVLAADFMPCGTAGCVGADASESWVIAPLASGAQVQLVKAATP
jgi:hypothetical protein